MKKKLEELIKCGYEDTGRTFKIMRGEFKGKAFSVYAQPGDIAGLVYNDETDKVEMVYKLPIPYRGKRNNKGI